MMTATAIALTPLAATAGNVSEPIVPTTVPVISTAPTAMDWSGAYVGLGYGQTTGDIAFTPGGANDLDDAGTASAFGGYQLQRGNLVFGGELAWNSTDDSLVIDFRTAGITDMIDLKGRVGFATGSFLIYCVLGYSMGEYDDNFTIANNKWDINGVNYGIGADYAFNKNCIVSAEYLMRDLDGDEPTGVALTTDINYDTLLLRVMYKF
jgi:outer membrane immunogenic protein